MARTDNFNNWVTDVANSIREKTGKTDKIPASEFDTEIKAIETEPVLQDKIIEITENGTTGIVADEGYDGLKSVDVTVNVETSGLTDTEPVYLIKDGIDQTVITGGHIFELIDADGPIREIQNDGYLSLCVKRWGSAEFIFNNPIDFSKYNKVYIEYDYPSIIEGESPYSHITIKDNTDVMTVLVNASVVEKTIAELDVSSLTTSNQLYLAVLNLTSSSAINEYPLNIYNVWLDNNTEDEESFDYITDGLVAWWEGKDGFDENVHWNSRVGNDYIAVEKYALGTSDTNPPPSVGDAICNNGVYGMVTQQDYCLEDFTIQVVGYISGVQNSSESTINTIVGTNMSASPMIGVDVNGYGKFANGSGVTHEKEYPNMLKKIFNASLNLASAPARGQTSALNHLYSVNGGSWYTTTAKSALHTPKGNNLAILCYYTESYRSYGVRLYSLRIYNRKLTEEELQHNYQIDKARFNIEE